MYQIPVEVRPSAIDGKGVFTTADIPAGTVVWKFTPNHDSALTQAEYSALPQPTLDHLAHTAYLSPWSGLWVFPPIGDPADYTNHSPENNLGVKFDPDVSPEPFFVANRDIAANEELTNNYHEFDRITQETKPAWAA